MVGREGELAVLVAAWEEVAAGGQRTLLVEGEAGIGKTRLVDRFLETVRERGGQLPEAACLPLLDVVPYLPLLPVLSALETQTLQELPRQGGVPLPDPSQRTRFFQRVADRLAGLATAGPVVLVVEDLHWADEATGDLLLFWPKGCETFRCCWSAPGAATSRPGPGGYPRRGRSCRGRVGWSGSG
jgi:predicted ATPase